MHLYFAMFGKLFALVATVHAVPTPHTWGIGTVTWIYIAGRDVNNYRVKRRSSLIIQLSFGIQSLFLFKK